MATLSTGTALAARLFRAIPRGVPGKGRLANWYFRRHKHLQDVELATRYGGAMIVPQLGEPVAFELMIHGMYEQPSLDFILAHLPAGGTFVEVGANVGAFTVPAAKSVGPSGRVLAIEASPRVFPYLERNLQRNGASNAIAVACAAHDHDDGFAPFWEAPASHFGMGSLAAQFHEPPVQIPVRTLDRLVQENGMAKVDLIKVDVEGFEAAVFRGATQLLGGPHPPIILFEFCDWAEERGGFALGTAQSVLLDQGFQLSRLGGDPNEMLKTPMTSGCEMIIARHRSTQAKANG